MFTEVEAGRPQIQFRRQNPPNCVLNFKNLAGGNILDQGRSDGGIWILGIYTPKSVQVNFLWGKNDVRTAIEHEY